MDKTQANVADEADEAASAPEAAPRVKKATSDKAKPRRKKPPAEVEANGDATPAPKAKTAETEEDDEASSVDGESNDASAAEKADDEGDEKSVAVEEDEAAAARARRIAARKKTVVKKEEESPRRRRGRDIIGVLVCVAVVLFARASLADHYVVPTGSMEPTVAVGDRVVVSKAAYGLRLPLSNFWVIRWGGPQRGDVVVLESPEGGTILLKRVVGLPGDTISVRDGSLIVNGKKMAVEGNVEDLEGKKHIISLESGGGPEWGPQKLPPEKYLVMGDNRGNSRDGRFFGLVDENAILGHAFRIYYSGGSFSWKSL